MNNEIIELLKKLKLKGILDTIENRLAQAKKSNLSYMELLVLLLQDEIQRRNSTSFVSRIKKADFEEEKTIEGLEMERYPSKIQRQIRELACGHYLQEKEHLILSGPTGTGKSHIAQALGHHACRLGKKVQFIRANALLRFMGSGRADESWESKLKKLLIPDLLIIDDFALKTFTANQAEDIYELIAERYLKKSIIITSNRTVEAWIKLFPDPVVANAAFDRLSHRAHHLILDGPSFRREHRIAKRNNPNNEKDK